MMTARMLIQQLEQLNQSAVVMVAGSHITHVRSLDFETIQLEMNNVDSA